MLTGRFELVVTLEGIVEPTGNSVQARSSYLPNEVLWGHRYQNMMSYNKKRGIYTVDCSNLNAVIQDDTPRISAKQADEKRRLEAKRLAQLRRKISAISQNSLKSPNAKLSVFTPRHVSKSQSMDECAAGKWNDSLREEGISASITTSTLCDKSVYSNSEIDCRRSLPTVTVDCVDNEKSSTSSPSYVAQGSNIWVTHSSGQALVPSSRDSSVEQDYCNIVDEISQSTNGDIVGVNVGKNKHTEDYDEITQLENGEGGVKIKMNENHIEVCAD